MKKLILLSFILSLFVHCTSIKKQNQHLDTLLTVEKLKEDVDFTYKKLQQLHPNLYYYSSKPLLDHKFDSLKNTITKPLKPIDFYKKLSPLVAAIKQGHSVVYSPEKQYSKKETKALIKKGSGPFSQFDFDIDHDKIYVIKNKSYDKSIQAGSEVVAVNNSKPIDLILEYNAFFTSDGYNTTFKKIVEGKRFPAYYTTENGIKDSLQYRFKYKDTIKEITIKRQPIKKDSLKIARPQVKKILTAVQKDSLKEFVRKKRINGYNSDKKNFNRNLEFIKKDSSVALIKIRGFKNKGFKTFYKESFKEIKEHNTSTLILDLRNNGGGRLSEINYLYSFLADSSFVFLDKSEVVSRASLFNGAYFNGSNLPVKALKTLFSPLVYGYLLFTVHKEKDGKRYYYIHTKAQKQSKNNFSGKIYVLINGGSFSASSIISSNLKGSKRATFVGQETGGGYNGTVAGFLPIIKLPNSDLKVRIGLMQMAPHFQTTVIGHGIYPDHEIIPTLQDKIEDRDPELDWILQDLKSNVN